MPAIPIPTEFDLELRSERGRWLRRRFLWLCAVGILLTIPIDGYSVAHYFSQGPGVHRKAAWIELVECALYVLLYGAAWIHARGSRLCEDKMLRLAFWLVVCIAGVELVCERWQDNVLIDPSDFRNQVNAAMVYVGIALVVLFVDHGFACLFMPWTVREALAPAGVMLFMYGAIVGTDVLFGRLPASGLLTIPILAIGFLPGTAICWLRFSRFRRNFRLTFESGRYRLLQGELASARRLHESSLPPQMSEGPIRLQYIYEPMREIGGDLLFVHSPPGNPNVLCMVVIDVTGHGIAAALTVNRLIGELERLFGELPDASPDLILRGLNRYVALTLARHTIFATALCVRLDTQTGQLQWTNGGHPPPFIRRGNGQIESLDPTAPLLGATDGSEFFDEAGQTFLNPGDVLLAYTDGLTEASNPDGKQLGLEGVRRLISEVSSNGQAIENWPRRMLAGVLNYRQSPVEDDTLVVALYRREPRDLLVEERATDA